MTKPLTLDQIFKDAKARGFVLCNMFQLEDDTFRCNWIAAGKGRSFGNDREPSVAAGKAFLAAVKELADEASTAGTDSDDDEDLIG